MSIVTNQISEVFAVLKPNLRVQPVAVTPSLYKDLDSEFSGFKDHVLVSMHEFTENWKTWEKHPAGDEVVMLLSGKVSLVLGTIAGEEAIALAEPGSYVIIPYNTWHTVRVSEPVRMLFLTPGEGTENREEPPSNA